MKIGPGNLLKVWPRASPTWDDEPTCLGIALAVKTHPDGRAADVLVVVPAGMEWISAVFLAPVYVGEIRSVAVVRCDP